MVKSIGRNIQIDLITDTYNPIIEWFNDLWSRLHIIESNVYHNRGGEIIYYLDGWKRRFVFFRDDNMNTFTCNQSEYWLKIQMKFDLDYDEIESITKVLVEYHLNEVISAPYPKLLATVCMIDDHLNYPI